MTPVPDEPHAARPRRRRWVGVLLVASLTLNLLVAGILAGAWLRGPMHSSDPGRSERVFGAWTAALDPTDSAALREALRARRAELAENWRAERRDRAAFVAALRAEPFDPAALDAIAGRMVDRSAQRLDVAHRLLADRIAAMSPEARRAYADRLEAAFRRNRRGDPGREGERR